jgi:hypothetical protein
VRLHELLLFEFERDVRVGFFDSLAMLFEALDHARVEGVKTHVNVRQMADRKRLYPNEDLLQLLN